MKPRWVLCIGTALFFIGIAPASAGQFDHSSYNAVLRHYVNEDGLVDYDSVRLNSLTALESYFERLADADPSGWSSLERLAFWINAYNARVLYLIAQKPGLENINSDLALFEQPFKVAGRMLTLNEIEHNVLHGADPRVHFALVNGTLGGPRLRNFAYTAENLNVALQVNAAAFANSYKYVGVSDGHLKLSSLLKWYADDFKSVGGVQAYLISLLSPEQGGDANAVRELLQTAYQKSSFTYDWTVNRQSTIAFKK